MELRLESLSKKYPHNKLFEDLNHVFESDTCYAITGENGSGKSTLIKTIAGVIPPSKGSVQFVENGKIIEKEKIHELLGISAPYLNLIEEFTLQEHIDFHSTFKKPFSSKEEIFKDIEDAKLEKSLHKPVGEFSSGMQQRLKLILCCSYNSQILLLDEPSSHLDESGFKWYKYLLKKSMKGRIVIIASNDPLEYSEFAKKIINIETRKG